jgi:hypothetical protein
MGPLGRLRLDLDPIPDLELHLVTSDRFPAVIPPIARDAKPPTYGGIACSTTVCGSAGLERVHPDREGQIRHPARL